MAPNDRAVRAPVDGRTVYFGRGVLTYYSHHAVKELGEALLGARFGPMPDYVGHEELRRHLALILDSRSCFIVKRKGVRYGTAFRFCRAPRDSGLRRGFRYVD